MAWYALRDSRAGSRKLDAGDLYLNEETARKALANALRDEPQQEPFLSMQELSRDGVPGGRDERVWRLPAEEHES